MWTDSVLSNNNPVMLNTGWSTDLVTLDQKHAKELGLTAYQCQCATIKDGEKKVHEKQIVYANSELAALRIINYWNRSYFGKTTEFPLGYKLDYIYVYLGEVKNVS